MAFSASGVFSQFPLAAINISATGRVAPTTASALKVALYNNTGTPDKAAAVASTGYNTGAWVTANEVTDATNWTATGRTLASVTSAVASNVYTLDAADLAGAGNVTMSGIMGCLVYDNNISAGTVAKQGICFNYFGGAQSVTAGTFTIVWNASGLMTITT